jgi:hypothetical protein
MTTAEWQTSRYALEMLEFLHGRADERGLRRFLAVCCRRAWACAGPRLTWQPLVANATLLWHLVGLCERLAEGQAGVEELALARADAARLLATQRGRGFGSDPRRLLPHEQAMRVIAASPAESALDAACEVLREGVNLLDDAPDLLRELFPPPGGGFIHPDWLAWNGGTVPALARAIAAEEAYSRLGILADALEDAGCNDAGILGHCRGPGPHIRGCWVLDALSGKP